MVEATGVSKWFGDVVAVSDVSFALGSGVTALLGPNGAGKSTMLRLLAGLVPPDRGELRILGRDPRVDLGVLRRIGLVPQQETVFDTQTALEFVHMAGVLHGIPRPERAARQALALVELEPRRPAPAEHLLAGHAPAGQGRAGDRAQPTRHRARRAAHRPRPAPAAPHDPACSTSSATSAAASSCRATCSTRWSGSGRTSSSSRRAGSPPRATSGRSATSWRTAPTGSA